MKKKELELLYFWKFRVTHYPTRSKKFYLEQLNLNHEKATNTVTIP